MPRIYQSNFRDMLQQQAESINRNRERAGYPVVTEMADYYNLSTPVIESSVISRLPPNYYYYSNDGSWNKVVIDQKPSSMLNKQSRGENGMTSCEEKGFKEGDLVRYARHIYDHRPCKIGTMFILLMDDGSSTPRFENVETGRSHYFYVDSFNPATPLALKKYATVLEERKKVEIEKALSTQRNRFTLGDYTPLPDNVLQAISDAGMQLNEEHFIHIAKNHPGLIAYTPEEDLIRDRQVPTKLGKYLASNFPDVDQPKIAHIANLFNLYCKEELYVFEIARTAEEIKNVYLNGPHSCMGKSVDYFSCGEYHPTEVYATEDVGVAYIRDRSKDRVVARAVLNMLNKTYPRIYGNEEALAPALSMAGYEGGNGLVGCRLQRIPIGKGFVMPYLDGQQGVDDDGEYLVVVGGNGTYYAREESGVIGTSQMFCEVCEEHHDEEDSHYSDWHGIRICDNCIDQYAYTYTGRTSRDWIHKGESDINYHDGEWYLDDALGDHNLGLDTEYNVHSLVDLVEVDGGDVWHIDECVSYEDKYGDLLFVHEKDSDEVVRDFFSERDIKKDDAFSVVDPDTRNKVYSYSEFNLNEDNELEEVA